MCTPHVGTLSASATGFGNPKNADVDASKSSAHVLNISTDVVSAAGLASGIVSNRSSSDNNSAVANKPTPANASTTTPGRPTVATGAVDASPSPICVFPRRNASNILKFVKLMAL